MAIVLSDATDKRLMRVFDPDDLQESRGLLENDCAENIAGRNLVSPEGLERPRFAGIKLSGGTWPE